MSPEPIAIIGAAITLPPRSRGLKARIGEICGLVGPERLPATP